jgi:hypothetical protein
VPNLLAHFAVQGAATRAIGGRRLDARWIYLGCLLPDVPWILRRTVVGLGLPVDAFDLRLYTMAQASFAGTLLLCAALAAVAREPRLVFAVLGGNALVHLLLDATEIKWGNGVHVLAPFSWQMTRFELLSGESPVYLALTLAGALVVASELVRRQAPAVTFDARPVRLAVAASFLAAYLLAPLAVLPAVEASGSDSVATLRDVAARPGRTVHFDRISFEAPPAGPVLSGWTGERLRVTGELPAHDATVSLRGTFLEPDLLRVDRLFVHRSQRDWPSYLGLVLLGLAWLRCTAPGIRTRRS